jgi:DNA-binding SARP family transcriptional activator
VLAVLLCADGEPVPVARLLREVWPDATRRPARKTLAVHVSRLRRLLPACAPIEHLADAYRLPAVRTDAHRFGELVADGRRRAASDDARGARAAYASALALWRGEPFAASTPRPWRSSGRV